jgi:hypothetical protein
MGGERLMYNTQGLHPGLQHCAPSGQKKLTECYSAAYFAVQMFLLVTLYLGRVLIETKYTNGNALERLT